MKKKSPVKRSRSSRSRHDFQQLERRDLLTGISLVSVALDGAAGNDYSIGSSMSENGRFIAFSSHANDLETNDNHPIRELDAFVRDTVLGTTELISVNSNGDSGGNSDSGSPSISSDGRYVAFGSSAKNLVANDTNFFHDVFVRDRMLGTTTIVSNGYDGSGNGTSYYPSISDDGRFIAFSSGASNLVLDSTNEGTDIFLADVANGTVTLLSSDASGVPGDGESEYPVISADGRYVVFHSDSENLVPGDTNGVRDVFRKDVLTGAVTRVSVGSGGAQGNFSSEHPDMSDDGRFVVFQSIADNLIANDGNQASDIFLRDIDSDTTVRVNTQTYGAEWESASWRPTMNSDGRFITFSSLSNDLVNGDNNAGYWDVFVTDMDRGTTQRYSTDPMGGDLHEDSYLSVLSGDGRHLTFSSMADNIVEGDANETYDVFYSGVNDATLVKERGVSYRNSAFPAGAIVPDKFVLLPGETATFENYSSYSRGINSLTIDLDGDTETNVVPSDFEFRFGNSDDVSTWTSIAPNVTVTFAAGGGTNSTDRVTLQFDDGAITNGWLQVRMLANANTGLAADDVFYFGNAISESGNDPNNAQVNLVDVGLARANQTGFSTAAIDNVYDFNRDARVNLVDVAIARSNQSGFGALQLITPNDSSTLSRGVDQGSDSKLGRSGTASVLTTPFYSGFNAKVEFDLESNDGSKVMQRLSDRIDERKLVTIRFDLSNIEPKKRGFFESDNEELLDVESRQSIVKQSFDDAIAENDFWGNLDNFDLGLRFDEPQGRHV